MRTFLRKLGRDTEQNIITLITSFLRTHHKPNEYLDLRIFITSRRHMGKLYLEHAINNNIRRRYYFTTSHWQKVRSMEVIWATGKLKEARSLLRDIGEPTIDLNKQIRLSEDYYRDIRFSLSNSVGIV